MFFALRDLRTARWRFTLITGVVLMLSVLVAGLLGLTAGLANQSVSALRALASGDTEFVLPADDSGPVDLDRAGLSDEQVSAVTGSDPSAVPVGIARVSLDDGSETGVSAVAVGLAAPVGSVTPPTGGEALVSTGVADEFGTGAGDDDEAGAPVSSITSEGHTLPVAGDAGDLWHSHTPVVVTDLDTWHEIAPRGGAATTVAASADALDPALVGEDAALAVVGSDEVVDTLPSYRGESTSLNTMTYMLLAVTALVVGAFFAVWGMQRRRDVAVLKALGASSRAVVRDSVGQAAIVLVAGVGGGVAIAALFGLAVGGTVPFVVDAGTTLVPAALLGVLGLAGAAVSLRPVLTADPTSALGAAR